LTKGDRIKGWSLNGTNKDIDISTLKCEDNLKILTIWKYKNNKWLLNTNIKNNLNLDNFDIIKANEGFWVNCKQ